MWRRADSPPFTDALDLASGRQAAVIDVGSNSVRLVVYRLEGRAIWTVFNEKSLAGLGRGMAESRRLSPAGVETAMVALRRFRALLDGWPDTDVLAVGTAAVREAVDGPAFLSRVEAETGLKIRVLTGEEEARYGALGVIAGDSNAHGLVGDLGGSSLELVRVAHGRPGDGVTLALGPFSLGAPRPLELFAVRDLVEARLRPVTRHYSSREFHAVGGGWRNLALLHMEMAGYPLHVTHQYEMSRDEALDVARFAARQSKQSLERIQGLSKKRVDTLPYSAVVLEALIEQLGIERLVVSAYGVREGLLLETMTPEERAQDPLIAGCEALANARSLSLPLGAALEAWVGLAFGALDPLFGTRDPILTAAACRLADLGARLHPDHRADVVFEQVLRAPIAGMSHPERLFLASTLFSRHTAAATTPPHQDGVMRLLSAERRQRARALGAAIRLGCDLSGRNPRLLPKSALALQGDRLRLTAAPGWADMLLGEQTAKRAATLAGVLKLRLQMG
jgi:exopolyphosphatase / guanosine-5'-triphosphate,3'-diphosphate pyrophosphatase